jgi:hypothetical protein
MVEFKMARRFAPANPSYGGQDAPREQVRWFEPDWHNL